MKRRDFLKGAFGAFGALFCGEAFAAPEGWKHSGTPNVVFGVISDTHLRTANVGNRHGANWPDKYLVAAFQYFKEQNVDAIANCGDMAHRGQVREMEFHAMAWKKVFGSVTNGPVKLFVMGNHDIDGAHYGDFVKKRYPDPVQFDKNILAVDVAQKWERIWGEKYEPVWHKVVKGYHFFGRHWGVDESVAIATLKNWTPPASPQPYFYFQHSRPLKKIRGGLLRHNGAVAFFGHNHWSISNWNVAFLYKGRLPVIECGSCEPRGCGALREDAWITEAAEIEGRDQAGRGRYGYLVSVYDDMIVFSRREFGDGKENKGGSLGADWIMPFNQTPHPFTRAEKQRVIGQPQFRQDAKLLVEWLPGAPVPAVPETQTASPTPAVATVQDNPTAPRVKVSIPLADGNSETRVYAYDLVVNGEDGTKPLTKAVYVAGCNLAMGQEPNGGVTTLAIPTPELPRSKTLTFTVTPITSMGTRGKPITTEYRSS